MTPIWRITKVWQKALYIVVGWGVFAGVLFALRTWVLSEDGWPYAIIALLVQLALPLFAVRVFRGFGEPVDPPRKWWRWTGRPLASFWLGALYLLGDVSSFVNALLYRDMYGLSPIDILSAVSMTIIAAGYLTSWFRLRLHPELWSHKRSANAHGLVSAPDPDALA